ncbi:hypothetical protein L596_021386 [Steinernema carpocapsae]|uniref:Uncharacterized protein n=1 Tax=Steinernema carpocapsae TaxID=34508 RepID=A0A4U5MIZ3_STECR|nr:hypothetical protein L596_021386 [Steinernema carpocapsae]
MGIAVNRYNASTELEVTRIRGVGFAESNLKRASISLEVELILELFQHAKTAVNYKENKITQNRKMDKDATRGEHCLINTALP